MSHVWQGAPRHAFGSGASLPRQSYPGVKLPGQDRCLGGKLSGQKVVWGLIPGCQILFGGPNQGLVAVDKTTYHQVPPNQRST